MSQWYLAGKMGGRAGIDVLAERKAAKDALTARRIQYYDPADGEDVSPDGKPIDLDLNYATMKNYVLKDERAIQCCDGVLVLTGDMPSEGTGLEFGLALQLGKPVILVAPKRVRGELMGFWNIKASAIFETVEEAAKFIGDNYAIY